LRLLTTCQAHTLQ